jgi:pimeloyl-ACP methyl ester carboxylesterase
MGASAAGQPFLLVHGTATTSRVWGRVRTALAGRIVYAPDRPSSGDLAREVDALRGVAGGAVLGGVSGGATLGLAMLAAGIPLAAAVLHEPAVGSLLPHLLAPMAAAYRTGGVEAFGRALYGSSWRMTDAPDDADAVARDLTMFLGFEPRTPAPGSGPVVITVGENSPDVRYEAAAVLSRELGFPVRVVPGCGHAAHLDAPEAFAALLLDVAAAATVPADSADRRVRTPAVQKNTTESH